MRIEKVYKEIFIFVAGTTPQIITETICALSQKTIPIYPDEIFIITILTGKRFIEKQLLDSGILSEMMLELGLPQIPITEGSFVVPKGANNFEIDDIRSEEENELMGNLITSLVRDKSNDPSSRLHCSIAGGRKTMSFYLGAALQLFGRPQDKLYHVLVTPEFELNPSFFYKPKKNRIIQGRGIDGKPKQLNTKNANIELAELPFIRLSGKISFQGKDFRELVLEGQRTIDLAMVQPELVVNLLERYIQIGDTIIEMLPIQLMFYTAFLRRKLFNCQHPDRDYCKHCTDCFMTIKNDLMSKQFIDEIADDHRSIYKNSPMRTNDFLEKWKDGITGEVIRQNISKIKKTIHEQIEDDTLKPIYTVSCVKQYPGSKYGVRVEKGKIRIV